MDEPNEITDSSPGNDENATHTFPIQRIDPPPPRIGPYEILSPLGTGGMGEVYLARDSRLGRDIALKLLSGPYIENQNRLLRFRQEARAVSALNHPNIVTIFELGQFESGHFIAMEFVDGGTLRRRTGEALPMDTFVDLAQQLATAAFVAHAAGVVHRDIKPENIMIRRDGIVKVVDFGLARLMGEDDSGISTDEGKTVGTARYMSPEQAQGHDVGPASDIFSLGLIFYELTTGRHPFAPLKRSAAMRAIVLEAAVPPSQWNPEIPPLLETLILRMLEKDANERPSAQEVLAALRAIARGGTAVGHTPARAAARKVVGREQETEILREAFASAKEGQGCVVAVSGESGIGKTTLVEEFLTEVTRANPSCRVARGRCSERLAGAEAYLPLLEALDGLLQSRGGHDSAAMMRLVAPSWYAEAVTSAKSRTGIATEQAEGIQSSQERLKREFCVFLHDVTQTQPLVLFLDDLHWTDASTIDLLTYLASRLDSMRVLLIVAYRHSDAALAKHPLLQVKADWQVRGICREIALSFLTEAEISKYLMLEFPGHQFPDDFCRLIHAKTEGSPLFMSDLLRYLRDRGTIATDGHGWALARPVRDIQLELPESVRGMIDRKIAQLSDEDRRLLTAASIQGFRFDSAVIARALELDPVRVEERLEILERTHELVRFSEEKEFPDRTPTVAYSFVHVLYQNALVLSVRATKKAQLTGAVAQALLDFYGSRSAEVAPQLAYLFEAARDYLQAAEFFRVAAHQAVQVFASQEAVTLARRGVSLLESLPDTPDRQARELPLQIVLGSLLMTTRGYSAPEVEIAYSRARQICRQLDESKHELPVLFGLFVNHLVRGRHKQALALGRDFLAIAERRNDPAVTVGYRTVGVPQLFLGELSSAAEHLKHATSLYDPAEHRHLTWLYGGEPGMIVRTYLSWTYWLLGYPDKALDECRLALNLMEEVRHTQSKAYALAAAAQLYQYRRDAPKVLEYSNAVIAISKEQGLALWLAWGTILRGWALIELKEISEGIASIRASMERSRLAAAEIWMPYICCLLTEGYQKAGRFDQALAVLDEAFQLIDKNSERYWEPEAHRLRAEILHASGATRGEIKLCIRHAIASARRSGARSLALRAAVSLGRITGDKGPASEILRTFTEGFDTRDLLEANEFLQR